MNPLTVTWAPLKATDIGRRNLDAFIRAGFDNVLGTPNGKVTRTLTRLAFQHLGDPFQPFIYGQTNFPLHMAVKYGVQLVMYGENGEVEYGGDMKNAFRADTRDPGSRQALFLRPAARVLGRARLSASPICSRSWRRRTSRSVENQTEIHFLGYYKFWDPQENFYYCRENTGFHAEHRSAPKAPIRSTRASMIASTAITTIWVTSSSASAARPRTPRTRFATARSRARKALRWCGATTANFRASTIRTSSSTAASRTKSSRKWSTAGGRIICGARTADGWQLQARGLA